MEINLRLAIIALVLKKGDAAQKECTEGSTETRKPTASYTYETIPSLPDKTLAASQLSSGTSGRITESNAEGAILHTLSQSQTLSKSPATGETSGEQELPQIGAEHGRVQKPVALLKS
jgi:hypothetical protein